MINESELNRILKEALEGVTKIYQDHMRDMILFGSYARGDYDAESDVDIALILKLSRAESEVYRKQLIELSSELDLKYDVLTSFRCIPASEYDYWKNTLPFYSNINREGVKYA